MKNIYVVGGQQKGAIYEEWQQYKMGVILKINIEQEAVERCFQYVSPPEVCPDNNPSILFKAGTVSDNKIYLCTQTEVLIYSFPNFKMLNYISLPRFNDLHHVRPSKDGNLLIVNTGLDTVLKVNPRGKILKEFYVTGHLHKKFKPNMDYRKVSTTKPHQSHPNFVFELGNQIWTTRCLQKDAICLTEPSKKMDIGTKHIHDGLVVGETIYFTQVDGKVVIADANQLLVKKVFDLKTMSALDKYPGWCRGIYVLDADKVIVGFSRIRPTEYIDKGNVLKNRGYGTLPTRIACYDLKKGEMLWQFPLEKYGLNSIFSIHVEN